MRAFPSLLPGSLLPGGSSRWRWAFALLFLLTGAAQAEILSNAPTVLVVEGAAGEKQFGEEFGRTVRLWQNIAERAQAKLTLVGHDLVATNDLEQVKAALEVAAKESESELWIVLVGHGTFNGKEAKFNLRGPDLSAADLAKWLEPVKRPVAVLALFSASAPFINALSRTNRVIVSATRSGSEVNFSRLGFFLSEALAGGAGDLDKDGQTSLLEAFLVGSRKVEEFYGSAGRLATEHALLDDNGDGLGTPAGFFKGVRAVKKAADVKRSSPEPAIPDGLRAHQFHLIRNEAEMQMPAEVRAQRDRLELDLAKLRDAKAKIKEDAYYEELEKLLVQIARLYETKESK